MRVRRVGLFMALVCLVPCLAAAQVDLQVTANPDPALNGEIVEVVLYVSNTGGASQANLVVELDYPAGLNNLSQQHLSDGGLCPGLSNTTICDAGELARWTLGTLAAGEARRISLPVTVAAATATGTQIPLNARVLQSAVSVETASGSITVAETTLLTLTLGADSSPAAPGSEIEYLLSFGNRSLTTLTDLTLSLPLPAGTSFVSASEGGTQAGASIEWTIPTLTPGLGTTRRARVHVDAPATSGSLLSTTATLAPAEDPGGDVRAGLVTRIASGSPLVLGMAANPDPAKPSSEFVEVELTVSNRGIDPLTNVVVEGRIPPGMANVSQQHLTGGGTCPSTSNTTICDPGERVLWSVGTLAAGQGVSVVLVQSVVASATPGSVIPYRAKASATGGHLAETSASVLVASAPRLDLALNVDRDPVDPGGVLTYTLFFGNESPTSTAGTALDLQLPPGGVLLAASNGGSQVGGLATWALGALPPRAGDVRWARVQLPPGTAGELVRPVEARVRDTASVLDEARATALARTATTRPLVARVVANPDPVRPGEMLGIEMVVANTGIDPILDVVASLRVPYEVQSTNEFHIESAGDCPSGANTGICDPIELLNWNLGALQAGEARTVGFPPRAMALATLAGTVMTLNADVRATAVHPASASTAVFVDDAPVLDLNLDLGGSEPALPGQPLDLIYSFGNEGATTRALRLELPLPPGSAFVSASNGGGVTGGSVGWNLLPLAPQQGGKRSLRLQLPAGGAGILDLQHARLVDVASPFEVARAAEAVQLEVGPPLSMSASAVPNPAARLATLDVDFSATNLRPDPIANLVIQSRWPEQLNSLGEGSLPLPRGDCPSLSNTQICDSREIINWPAVTLDPAAISSVSMPPVVANAAILGSHLQFRARVFDPNGLDAIASRSIRVGAVVDTDGDGIGQHDDNCPVFANPGQADTDLDGRGDPCECGDQNLDGRNTVSDLVAINVAIFNPATITPLCDANGDGACNVNDIIAANIEIFSPTSTSTCSRHPVPGP